MKTGINVIVGLTSTLICLFMFSLDYQTIVNVINPQLINAGAFIIAIAFMLYTLDQIVKWDKEEV